MKIVIAPDKFKGSLSGLEFCDAVEKGIKELLPLAEILKLPLADGGDGTIQVANYYLKGSFITAEVNNPLFHTIQASYLFSESSKTAFIEMAEASGLKLLRPEEYDCKNTSTIGTGELILDAIHKGAKKIILGIGGSATNDCGIGMATVFGYRFLDKNNKEVNPIGANLSEIIAIDDVNVNPILKSVKFSIACDVTNPLYGKSGAAHVYAKQKGASVDEIELLDKGLLHFSNILDAHFNVKSNNVIGAGAAGGMGIGTHLFLKGAMNSGIALIKELANFDEQIKNSDWIITGEGRLDSQTLSGKTINGVVASAKKQGIPVAAFCGSVATDLDMQKKLGLTYVTSVIREATSLEEAMKNSYKNLVYCAFNFAQIIQE